MKKNISFLLVGFICIVSCNKDDEDGMNGVLEPTQTQRALVVETTGTWCQYCPNGAATLKYLDYLYDGVLSVAVHQD